VEKENVPLANVKIQINQNTYPCSAMQGFTFFLCVCCRDPKKKCPAPWDRLARLDWESFEAVA
jgi:hypothetical protein